jgi:2-methylaconitate cis-trans-isomerase PrpF
MRIAVYSRKAFFQNLRVSKEQGHRRDKFFMRVFGSPQHEQRMPVDFA